MSILSDVRVVSIALNLPGPMAASHLRDFGATVLKVEPPSGDPMRLYTASWYDEMHVGVRVRTLDLKTDAGRAAFLDELAGADLLITSQRPSALARLRVDHASLVGHPATAHIRSLAIVGDRQRPEVAGHDLTYAASAGLVGSELPRTVVADILCAERATTMALALLRQPPGSSAEVGIFDTLSGLVAARRHRLTTPGDLLGGGLPEYGLYAAREGRVAVAALEPHFRTRLYAALELTEGASLEQVFRSRSAEEWEAWADQRDLPLCRVRD